ncbi:MAG: phytoene desaturase family protein, partial [Tannerellaceae bacterium]
MEKKKVIVVGAGFGGLCTALRLASKGFDVEIVEQNANAGGRLNIIEEDGFRFDTGPTFFSMSYEFEEMAKDCNIKLPFEYERVDPLYAVNFANGNNYLLTSDIANLSKQFEHLEPEFEQKFKRYIDRGKYIFDSTIQPIVKTNHSSMIDYIKSMAQTPPELGLMLLRNFWQEVCRYFTNEEVRQIMSLVAFFLGDTPFKTSSIYTLLSYTEFCHDGYYNVKGGLYKIVEGMVDVLKEHGVTFTFKTRIVGLEQENERVVALVADNGTCYKADLFVVNMDAALFRGRVLKRKVFDENHL